MSYDIEIRSDSAYSQSLATAVVAHFISSLPAVQAVDSISFTYSPTSNHYMIICLEEVDGNGSWTENESPLSIQIISAHISGGFMSHNDKENAPYFDLCRRIAIKFGWRMYDPQYGVYI